MLVVLQGRIAPFVAHRNRECPALRGGGIDKRLRPIDFRRLVRITPLPLSTVTKASPALEESCGVADQFLLERRSGDAIEQNSDLRRRYRKKKSQKKKNACVLSSCGCSVSCCLAKPDNPQFPHGGTPPPCRGRPRMTTRSISSPGNSKAVQIPNFRRSLTRHGPRSRDQETWYAPGGPLLK